MAQASLRLGRSLTNQAIRRQFSCGVALSGKHVSYSVQDGVAVLRYVMKLIRDCLLQGQAQLDQRVAIFRCVSISRARCVDDLSMLKKYCSISRYFKKTFMSQK